MVKFGIPLYERDLGFFFGVTLFPSPGDDLEEAPLKPVGLLYYQQPTCARKPRGAISRELLN